jgi:copper ion binding protein
MKRLATLLLAGSLAAPAVLACGACAPNASAEPTAAVTANHRATLKVEGMTCASCSVTVKTAAKKLDGLATIEVDVAAGTATVTFDSARVTAEQIAATITDAGYKTTVESDKEV